MLRRRFLHAAAGFTITELLIVILIMSIIIGAAMPTFLGSRDAAKDADAQATAVSTAKSARAIATVAGGRYPETDALVERLVRNEGAYTFRSANDDPAHSAGPKEVSVWVSSDRRVVITAARSETDTCWFVRDSLSEGTRYGALEEAGSTDCDAGHPNLDVSDFRNEAVPTQNGRELTTPAKVDLSSSEG